MKQRYILLICVTLLCFAFHETPYDPGTDPPGAAVNFVPVKEKIKTRADVNPLGAMTNIQIIAP